jgi:hypothetical protein
VLDTRGSACFFVEFLLDAFVGVVAANPLQLVATKLFGAAADG